MKTRAIVVTLVLALVSVAASLHAAPPVFVKAQLGVASHRAEVEKTVLQGEVPGITATHVALSGNGTFRLASSAHDIVYLVLDGRGVVKANGTPIDVERQMIVRLPVGWTAEWSAAPGATLDVLAIRHELSTEDRADLAAHAENQKAPWVKKFSECPTYGEAIKSAKTTSRTLLPKDIVPRMSIGTVETVGPDKVAPHAHPMLEQFFLGLDGSDIVVHADGGRTPLGAHELLHIPLGSSHGAEVAAGKTLHYVWMDFFRDREGLKWLETHKPNEPSKP